MYGIKLFMCYGSETIWTISQIILLDSLGSFIKQKKTLLKRCPEGVI